MARWYIEGPLKGANETELKAYRVLRGLDDCWSVRWTYHYLDGTTAREGDFLILGPDGRLLVLEVKKCGRLYFSEGRADERGKGKDDVTQVLKEKAAVVAALKEKARENEPGYEMPFVSPAVFSGKGKGFVERSKQFPVAHIKGEEELGKLAEHWENLMAGSRPPVDPDKVRKLFHAVYGDSSPNAEGKFLQSTDRLILDRLAADMTVLEGLRENRQILVRGGAGSGKSWMAERLARKWAEDRKRVLFLCYNKALGGNFRDDLTKGAPDGAGGSVTVRIWEQLAEEMAARLPREQPALPPEGKKDHRYYEETLPALLQEGAGTLREDERYDALVVDEGQDHDTDWWSAYLLLLRDGAEAPMGIFYDPAQRPMFRKHGGFDIKAVAGNLSQPAHFRLPWTRRYTRPLFDFLQSLESEQTRCLIADLVDDHRMLAGPEVVEHSGFKDSKSAKDKAKEILGQWLATGMVEADDVLILTAIDPFAGSSRWFTTNETFAGKRVISADAPGGRDGKHVRVTSFHKAKGLDAKAVILMGTQPWSGLRDGDREGFWIAASRARQLLAVLTNGRGAG